MISNNLEIFLFCRKLLFCFLLFSSCIYCIKLWVQDFSTDTYVISLTSLFLSVSTLLLLVLVCVQCVLTERVSVSQTGQEHELLESMPLLEWFANNYKKFGATLEIVTDKSQEGSQFVKGFGGIGGES